MADGGHGGQNDPAHHSPHHPCEGGNLHRMLTISDTGSEQHDCVGKDAKDHVAAEPLLHVPTHQAFPVVFKVVCI